MSFPDRQGWDRFGAGISGTRFLVSPRSPFHHTHERLAWGWTIIHLILLSVWLGTLDTGFVARGYRAQKSFWSPCKSIPTSMYGRVVQGVVLAIVKISMSTLSQGVSPVAPVCIRLRFEPKFADFSAKRANELTRTRSRARAQLTRRVSWLELRSAQTRLLRARARGWVVVFFF